MHIMSKNFLQIQFRHKSHPTRSRQLPARSPLPPATVTAAAAAVIARGSSSSVRPDERAAAGAAAVPAVVLAVRLAAVAPGHGQPQEQQGVRGRGKEDAG